MDIIESPNGYELSANVPGYKKDELTVNVDSAANTITVTAQKKDSSRTDTVEGGYRVHRRERSETYAQRVLGLPSNIKRDAIKSELKEGVLHVTMPKTAESVANQPTRSECKRGRARARAQPACCCMRASECARGNHRPTLQPTSRQIALASHAVPIA